MVLERDPQSEEEQIADEATEESGDESEDEASESE